MFFSQNKGLLLGTLAVAGVWLAGYYFLVSDNWTSAAEKLQTAETLRGEWEENFKSGANLLPKVEAVKALEDNKKALNANMQALQKIEFGTREALHAFTEAAAGTGDKKNYLDQKRITIANHANDVLHIKVPPGLGIFGEKAGDDPVALNLLRLALMERFIKDCQRAGVAKIIRIQHHTPHLVHGDETAAEAAPEEETKPAAKKKGQPEKPVLRMEKLVQLPMKAQVMAPERSFGKLLYELQKPTDPTHGYFCVRGFHVAVRDTGSGMIEATLGVSALLNEKFARDQNIPVKGDGDARTAPKREVDLERGY